MPLSDCRNALTGVRFWFMGCKWSRLKRILDLKSNWRWLVCLAMIYQSLNWLTWYYSIGSTKWAQFRSFVCIWIRETQKALICKRSSKRLRSSVHVGPRTAFGAFGPHTRFQDHSALAWNQPESGTSVVQKPEKTFTHLLWIFFSYFKNVDISITFQLIY